MKWCSWIMLFTSLVFIFGAFFNAFMLAPNAVSADERNSGSGDLGGKPNPKTITIDKDKTIAASFTPDGTADIDWSVKMCDSILSRFTPQTFGPWDYNEGLVLEGMWRVYQRTANTDYYDFIKSWVDRFVTDEGLTSDVVLDKLDNMMPGVLLCHLYEATGESKYQVAAQQIRNRLATYTRTSDGGLVLSISESTRVLALDGTFMLSIFLINYGEVFGDTAYANDECASQLIIHNNHLKDTVTGLAWQAWDESGESSWADPETHLSPEIWCRAVGWYVVACIEVLEKLPTDHPDRQTIIDILIGYLDGIKNYQDSITGLWYQVVDKGDLADNWVEESSTCLYTYAMSKAIDAGYISSDEYYTTAMKGFEGALSNIELNAIGKTNLYGTCTGTGPGSPYSYYIDRDQPVNDKHGLGAFLFAFEQQRLKYSDLRQLYQAENGLRYHARTESSNKGWTGASYVNFDNQIGSYLQVKVDSTVAGMTTLVIRYANGDTFDRPMEISINGIVISSSLSFVPTNAWTTRSQQTISVRLDIGENVIQFKSITDDGGPNIDWLAHEAPVIFDDAPVVTDIPDQTIARGASFATINLDDYVSDVDNTDAEMTWTYRGNIDLTITMDASRVATIGVPRSGWSGTETITFRTTDPDAFYDEDDATFTVTAGGGNSSGGSGTVSSLEISPDVVNIGENVNVSVRVDNTGEGEGVFRVFCTVDGVVVDDKEIMLAGGTGESVVFTLVIEEAGSKVINVNGLTGSLFVKEVEEESGVATEIPIPEIPEEPASASGYWWIILLILGVCALIIFGVIYLVKHNKI